MRREDQNRVRHMVEAAREAVGFASTRTRDDLEHDRMFALAVVRCIEIIGEAATRLSEEAKAEYPNIPWRSVIGMRNRLVHAYWDIDPERVWDTLELDLPALISMLEAHVALVEQGDAGFDGPQKNENTHE